MMYDDDACLIIPFSIEFHQKKRVEWTANVKFLLQYKTIFKLNSQSAISSDLFFFVSFTKAIFNETAQKMFYFFSLPFEAHEKKWNDGYNTLRSVIRRFQMKNFLNENRD